MPDWSKTKASCIKFPKKFVLSPPTFSYLEHSSPSQNSPNRWKVVLQGRIFLLNASLSCLTLPFRHTHAHMGENPEGLEFS